MSSTDLLVVGSGPVGSTFARLVHEARPEVEITMVEVGPRVTEPPGANVRNALDPDDRARARALSQGPRLPPGDGALPFVVEGTVTAREGTYLAAPGRQDGMPAAAVSSCVGGQAVHWTCATPRPEDSERIPFIPAGELDAALDEAERLLAVRRDGLPETPYGRAIRELLGAEFDGRLPAGRGVQPLAVAAVVGPDGAICWGGADTVLGATPVTLRDETICRRLVVDGDRVTGAEVEHLPTGQRETIRSRAVVVAADALHTPQLLWASGIRPEALGRYLSEHVVVYSVIALGAQVAARAGIDVPAEELVTDPIATTLAIPFSDGVHPYRAQIMHLVDPPIPVDETAVEVGPARFVAMGYGCRKHPRPEDRVTFSDDELDAWGMPQLTIHYALTEREREDLERVHGELERAAAALGRFVPGGAPRQMPNGTSLHYKGTIRMGLDGGTASVCDDRSRVWGLGNLFLGGNGLIPTATASNPTLTSVALAVRAVPSLLEALA